MKQNAVLAALSSLFILAAVPSLALAAPKGAVKLSSEKVFESNGFHCGQRKTGWVPGRLIKRGFFYPHAAERRNILGLARQASGKRKKRLTRRANNFRTLIAERLPVCQQGQGSQALRFDLSGAVGLTLGSTTANSFSALQLQSANASRSNMRKANGAGQLSEVVTSGTGRI